MELIDRLAALVPSPRAHRHRYYGVLAPHSPLRAAATELAAAQPPAYDDPGQSEAAAVPGVEEGAYTVCGGQMRIIAFITDSDNIRHILAHIGVETEPPHITPARWPPLWDGASADADFSVDVEPVPDWDEAAQASQAKALNKHLKSPRCADLGGSKSVLYLRSCGWISYPVLGVSFGKTVPP